MSDNVAKATAEYSALSKADKKNGIDAIAEKYGMTKFELVSELFAQGAMTRRQVSAYARYNPEYAKLLGDEQESESAQCNVYAATNISEGVDLHENMDPFFPFDTNEPSEDEGAQSGIPASVRDFVLAELQKLSNEALCLRKEIQTELRKNKRLFELAQKRRSIVDEYGALKRFANKCTQSDDKILHTQGGKNNDRD